MFRSSSSTPSSISDAETVSAITGQEDRVSLPSMHFSPGRQAYFQIICYIYNFIQTEVVTTIHPGHPEIDIFTIEVTIAKLLIMCC
jgi:hypothetical protein